MKEEWPSPIFTSQLVEKDDEIWDSYEKWWYYNNPATFFLSNEKQNELIYIQKGDY